MTRVTLTGGNPDTDYMDITPEEDESDPTLRAKVVTTTINGEMTMERYAFAYDESDSNIQISVEANLLEKGYSW